MVTGVDLGELHEQRQQRLIEFLETDLDLAFTFVRMAQTREKANARNRLLRNARRVLEAVRRFEGRIVDARAWATIHERADELERVLSTFAA
jgi:hypothetical protein